MGSRYPSYLNLLKAGELERRAEEAWKGLEDCHLCPRNCGVNRLRGQKGVCRVLDRPVVASYGPHFGEERPLVGRHGSGTIFMSYCNLACVFCQNYDISQEGEGLPVSHEKLAGMMLSLQEQGCHNINIVSPSHVIPMILKALVIAAREGLRRPLVYNTGGYDAVDSLRLLDGVVDIYMPDMKYHHPEVGLRFSLARDYPERNREAVKEMHRQVGDLVIRDGLAVKGLLVRHLVLPEGQAGTREILRFLAREISPRTYVNIMAQYRPAHRARRFPPLDRSLTLKEYREAIQVAREEGLTRLDEENGL